MPRWPGDSGIVGRRGGIGERLARLRRRRALTQEELAERAGVSVELVRKLEQGRRRGSHGWRTPNVPEGFSLVRLGCAVAGWVMGGVLALFAGCVRSLVVQVMVRLRGLAAGFFAQLAGVTQRNPRMRVGSGAPCGSR